MQAHCGTQEVREKCRVLSYARIACSERRGFDFGDESRKLQLVETRIAVQVDEPETNRVFVFLLREHEQGDSAVRVEKFSDFPPFSF
jgi:hypothetical protein